MTSILHLLTTPLPPPKYRDSCRWWRGRGICGCGGDCVTVPFTTLFVPSTHDTISHLDSWSGSEGRKWDWLVVEDSAILVSHTPHTFSSSLWRMLHHLPSITLQCIPHSYCLHDGLLLTFYQHTPNLNKLLQDELVGMGQAVCYTFIL